VPFDVGERVLADVLLGRRIHHIDTLVVTNFRHESLGGLLHVLEHFDVDRVVDPFGPDLRPQDGYAAFLQALGDTDRIEDHLADSTHRLYETYADYRAVCARRGIPILKASPGMELLHPTRPQEQRYWLLWIYLTLAVLAALASWILLRRKLLRLRTFDLVALGVLLVLLGLLAVLTARGKQQQASLQVLAPLEQRSGPGALESSSVVLRLDYQSFSALLPSDLQAVDQQALLERLPPELLQADVLLIPDGGWPEALHEPFLQTVRPRIAVNVSHQERRHDLRKVQDVLDVYRKTVPAVYPTQDCGAVLLESDGQSDQPAVHTVRPCDATRQ
jgi:hypothetical protein